jgi:biopolymer transport protein ExbD
MRRLVWAALAASACGSSSKEDKVPCAGSVELRRWLADLAADGPPGDPGIREEVTLAVVEEPPRAAPHAVSVMVARCVDPQKCPSMAVTITAQGELIAGGSMSDAAANLTAKLLEVRERLRADEEWKVLFLVDGGVAWADVAAVVSAAARAEVRTVGFAFETRAMRASPPPPSSIDAELARLDAEWAAQVADGKHAPLGRHPPRPSLADKVYARCPGAQRMANGLLSETIASDDKIQALVERVPDEIAACGCKVELAALKQLFWRLWDRHRSAGPLAWIEVEVAPDGVPVAATATEPWSRASARIVEAARARSPIGLP